MLVATTAAVVAAVAAPVAAAQEARLQPAFPRALTPWIGLRSYGDRLTEASGAEFYYSSSLTIGVHGERPLSRRVGLYADLGVSPLTKQAAKLGDVEEVTERVLVGAVDVGLAGRLKPAVPVYFFAGGGVVLGAKSPVRGSDGSSVEPQLSLGAGYDAAAFGAWNVRTELALHLVKPSNPDENVLDAKSVARDWSFRIGLRYAPSRRGATTR
jgi:hypothetical protein